MIRSLETSSRRTGWIRCQEDHGPFPESERGHVGRTGFPLNNYFITTKGEWQNVDQGDIRIDHRISDKDSLFGT